MKQVTRAGDMPPAAAETLWYSILEKNERLNSIMKQDGTVQDLELAQSLALEILTDLRAFDSLSLSLRRLFKKLDRHLHRVIREMKKHEATSFESHHFPTDVALVN